MERGVSYGHLSAILVLSLLVFAGSDVISDRNECSTQLVGLATCLPYAEGVAKIPTKGCCDGLKTIIDTSKKCLCILVKDIKDPQLGIIINTTLAFMLPATCHTPVSISACLDLLHLDPNSKEAQIFKQFDGNSSPPASSNAVDESNGSRIGGKRRLWGLEMEGGLWIWCVASMLLIMGS